MTTSLTRDLLYSDAVKAFELTVLNKNTKPEEKPLTIRDMTLDQVVHHVQTVGADDSLITSKLIDTVIRGAEEDETLWKQAATVAMMTSEIQRVPLITPDDFIFRPWVHGTKARASGGAFWAVKLDCSQSAGLYGASIDFTKNDLKAGGYPKMEEALFCAGQSVGRLILQAINAELLADVNAAMTNTMANWGNDHYKSSVKMESLIAAQGITPEVEFVNPTEGYDMGILDYFIRDDYARAAGGIPKSGHLVGSLYGRLPIYRHRDITTASMIMLSKKAIAVGIYQDVTIEDYEDVREGLSGAVVSVQFDVKSAYHAEGPSGATSPLTKAWAVTTAA